VSSTSAATRREDPVLRGRRVRDDEVYDERIHKAFGAWARTEGDRGRRRVLERSTGEIRHRHDAPSTARERLLVYLKKVRVSALLTMVGGAAVVVGLALLIG
jgi:hypothetical protein